MTDIELIAKEVSKKTGIDEELVRRICKHPFLEVQKIMKDKEETRDILFNNLFKFKLKTRYKENKSKEYTSK